MRVVICDDHRLFAEAMAVVLSSRGHEVVGCAATPAEAVSLVESHPTDICVMDLQFPRDSGLTGTTAVLSASPETRVVVLTGTSDPTVLAQAVRIGAQGIAVKDDDVGCLVETLERVHAGEVVFKARILQAAYAVGPQSKERSPAQFLTPREREVLERLVRGESTATLAAGMGVQYSTARTHIQNTLTKLGVHSKLEAVAFAISNGVVALEPPASDDGRR